MLKTFFFAINTEEKQFMTFVLGTVLSQVYSFGVRPGAYPK
jgi:hypothetical protein